MNDGLRSIGSCRGADGILVGMSVETAHDDVISYVAGPDREVAALPEALSPVAFADVLELLLGFARGAPLGPAGEVGDRHMRRDFRQTCARGGSTAHR